MIDSKKSQIAEKSSKSFGASGISMGSSDSRSIFSSSSHSSRGKSRGYVDRSRYKWESSWEFIVITCAALFSCQSFTLLINKKLNADLDPSFLQYLCCFFFVGMPIMYMEIVIGQYTSLGATQLRYLNPISHGLGFTLLLVILIRSVKFGLLMADYLMYFLITFQKDLQWLLCPDYIAKRCWTKGHLNNCTKKCLDDAVEISAIIYWREVYMGSPNLNSTNMDIGIPNVARSVTLTGAWFLMFIIIIYGMSTYKEWVKMSFTIVLINLCILLFVVLLSSGSTNGLAILFTWKPDSLLRTDAWASCLSDVIELCALGRAIHIMHGSFLTSNHQAGILTISTMALLYATTILAASITYGCIGIIMKQAIYPDEELNPHNTVWGQNANLGFTLFPQAIGFVGAPQLWCISYFTTNLLILVNNQMVHVLIVERCITDTYPRLIRYRKYMMAFICLLYGLLGLLFSSNEIHVVARHVTIRINRIAEVFNTLLLCIFVFYVYGIQRLCDDIHFFMGSQPTQFWKICWAISPLALSIPCIYHFFVSQLPNSYSFKIMHYCLVIAVISPLPIMFVIEIFRHLKQHNLAGILQPHERWGPADPEERHLRHLFNPRHEIRSRRRVDTCNHKCLLGGKILRRFVDEERQMRAASKYFLDEYDSNPPSLTPSINFSSIMSVRHRDLSVN